ncbi:MAG: flagellar protein FlaG [Synergistaceae bacterium]|jgi:uncharacterized FlaG/YvyC family protein|nr:flagellar protein FlaG [Synergistaceae bacterium]
MEVKLLSRETTPFEKPRSEVPPGFKTVTAPNKAEAPLPLDMMKATESESEAVLNRETVADLTERAAELLSVFDRELKYEVLKEAGVVQLQVIDARDGRVVRKVPADEIIKLIQAMKEKLDDRVDVWA